MRKISIFISLLLISLHLYGHREDTYFLYGAAGDRELVMRLDEFGGSCLARYFTAENKYDRTLEGTITEIGKFNLYTYLRDPETQVRSIRDSLFLEEYETDRWRGTWYYEDGTRAVVSLRPIIVDSLCHPYLKAVKKYRISPYTAYRTKGVAFKELRKQKIGKGAYVQFVEDPESEMAWFRVIPNRQAGLQADAINERLTANHLVAIDGRYRCTYRKERAMFSYQFRVHFLNEHLVSYTVTSRASCYGERVEVSVTHFTLKLEDAQPAILEELFWFGEDPPPKLSKGEYLWFQYRNNVFGEKVLEILTDLYPEKILNGRENGCNYNNVKIWQFPEWYLTRKHLYVGSKSPISNRKCDLQEWSRIPYRSLEPYAQTDFGLLK